MLSFAVCIEIKNFTVIKFEVEGLGGGTVHGSI